tara:strand:- start:96 stop:1451 length:1356 start_codon:yes stop_codon:yes gene_type:complete
MKTIWIANPLACWTGVDEQDAGGGLVVSGNRVIELVPKGTNPKSDWTEKFNARGLVVLPGLINCHHHFYQTLTRAYPDAQNKELFAWLKALYKIWAQINEEDVYLSTQLALAELWLSGCTTASDHHYLFSDNTGQAIDVQASAANSMGARVILTRGSMSLGESDGGLPPDSVVQTEQAILDDSERLIKNLHSASDDAMVQLALAPCSPFSVTGELMQESAKLARRYGVLLHTHLAETEDENNFCERTVGMRPLDYLDSLGWVSDDVWLAHGIHFNSEEISRMGKAGMSVCHCPSSNMILASGIARTLELEAAGVTIGLGVDGSASNDHSNMIQEVRQAFLIQRLRYGSTKITAKDALRWATEGGAKMFKRESLGKISVNAVADLAFFDPTDDLRFSGSLDPITALVTSGANRAKHLMVNGEWKVRDNEIVGLDIHELRDMHQIAANKLLKG